VEFIVVAATVDIAQRNFDVFVDFIVVTAAVDVGQWYCVVCGVYCGYGNCSYRAIVLCFVCSLLWLQQQ